jgi:hypothetical protein
LEESAFAGFDSEDWAPSLAFWGRVEPVGV